MVLNKLDSIPKGHWLLWLLPRKFYIGKFCCGCVQVFTHWIERNFCVCVVVATSLIVTATGLGRVPAIQFLYLYCLVLFNWY